MDYKAKYEEALERAKKVYKDIPGYLQNIFPELRGSEDERIRQQIEQVLIEHDWSVTYLVSRKNCLAWLERQKTPSVFFEPAAGFDLGSAVVYHNAESEDEKIRKNCIHFLELQKGHHADTSEIDKCLAWLKKQKEQKPPEWGEEDKENYKWFDKFFRAESIVAGGRDIPQDKYLWFKSLRPQPKCLPGFDEMTPEEKMNHPLYLEGFDAGREVGKVETEQQQQEWSEEDEDVLNSCICSIEEAKENRYAYKETDGDTSYDHEINWLKSLRPQPKWKPNEAQMNELHGALIPGHGYDCDVLQGLYADLKKLMEDEQ